MRNGRLFIISVIIIMFLSFIAISELTSSFLQSHVYHENENILCIKNYNANASITESYTDFESLDKETTIVSRSGEGNSSNSLQETSINSQVVGQCTFSLAIRQLPRGVRQTYWIQSK